MDKILNLQCTVERWDEERDHQPTWVLQDLQRITFVDCAVGAPSITASFHSDIDTALVACIIVFAMQLVAICTSRFITRWKARRALELRYDENPTLTRKLHQDADKLVPELGRQVEAPLEAHAEPVRSARRPAALPMILPDPRPKPEVEAAAPVVGGGRPQRPAHLGMLRAS